MSLPSRYLLASAAFAACTIAGASAYAQAAAPQSHSEVRIVRDGGEVQIIRDGKVMMMRQDGERRGDRAQHLRAVLQLRPSQEAALAAYVQALEGPRRDMMFSTGGDGAQTTPERLAVEEKMLNEHVALMRTRIEATRRFYDQLDPAQKRAFDELGEGSTTMIHRVRFDHPPGRPPLPPLPPVPPPPPPGF
jgi:hypothetical protein